MVFQKLVNKTNLPNSPHLSLDQKNKALFLLKKSQTPLQGYERPKSFKDVRHGAESEPHSAPRNNPVTFYW